MAFLAFGPFLPFGAFRGVFGRFWAFLGVFWAFLGFFRPWTLLPLLPLISFLLLPERPKVLYVVKM
jgi:hypothetical protein